MHMCSYTRTHLTLILGTDLPDSLLLKYLMHKHEKQSLIFNVKRKKKNVMPSICNFSTWRQK